LQFDIEALNGSREAVKDESSVDMVAASSEVALIDKVSKGVLVLNLMRVAICSCTMIHMDVSQRQAQVELIPMHR
jgi:hypothetical protein